MSWGKVNCSIYLSYFNDHPISKSLKQVLIFPSVQRASIKMGNSESEAETGSIIPKKKVKRTGSFEGAWTQIYSFNKPAKNKN